MGYQSACKTSGDSEVADMPRVSERPFHIGMEGSYYFSPHHIKTIQQVLHRLQVSSHVTGAELI